MNQKLEELRQLANTILQKRWLAPFLAGRLAREFQALDKLLLDGDVALPD